ncbi:MAG: 50S ribosomal protein L5 [Candidatus Thermoplasmatota archaeon]|jgi:large subunit ribosomal protein L5|nr:50S ribosomal protein L5 [Candidatus Thermoplasmatota archaeon]MCL5962994.1 50S ribosomal protein L5 [Candidatus Thermoplasmatota archaeon]
MNDSNAMRTISIEKVVINIGVGEAGEKVEKAVKVLGMITGKKPVLTISKTTNRDLGIRVGMKIGCKITLRGTDAFEFLKKAFWVKNNKIASYSIDKEGNFSFGITDYTLFPGMKYDPEIGIFGMDISCSLKRKAGWRVKYRKIAVNRIGKKHRIDRNEGVEYIKKSFNVEVI